MLTKYVGWRWSFVIIGGLGFLWLIWWLIVYREPGAVKLRAIYFDSEGHVIHYAVDPSADGNAVQFLSDPSTSYPRYRLTYTKTGADKVAIQFDISVPAKPDSFTTYIQATAHRK